MRDVEILYSPQNDGQRRLQPLWRTARVVFLTGPAGTGKTHAAIGHALADMQRDKRIKLILARPMVPMGERLGFLPGDVSEKLMPWMGPFRDVLGVQCNQTLESLLTSGRMEPMPVGMLRGRTVRDATLIVDEAQNLTLSQLRGVVTRIGRNGRIVLCGDPEQRDTEDGELDYVAHRLRDVPGVVSLRFTDTDQLREPIITDILERI